MEYRTIPKRILCIKWVQQTPQKVFTNNSIGMSLLEHYPESDLADEMLTEVTAHEEEIAYRAELRRQLFEQYDSEP